MADIIKSIEKTRPGGDRPLVFISHATPEDNEFVLWLGTRLTALGYEVWADILKLRGGQDWTEELERALKEGAAKFVLVCTPTGLQKKGVQREIKLAQQVGKAIGDDAFILPIRKEKYELTFDTALAQYIDFTENWGQGLVELAATLEQYGVPRSHGANFGVGENWRALIDGERAVAEKGEERLISNALPITQLPKIGIYEASFAGREVIERALGAITLPHARIGDCVLGFYAAADYLADLNRALSFKLQYDVPWLEFVQNGFAPIGLAPIDARRQVVSLLRQHWDAHCRSAGLSPFEFAGKSMAWWPTLGRIGDNLIGFPSPYGGGRRQLVGTSRELRWHYGVTAIPRIGNGPSFTLVNRVIFTTDGTTPVADAVRMHRLRRSRRKMWHNDRWRDLMLAFAHWLAEENDTISLSCGSNDPIEVSSQPRIYVTDVRLVAPVEESSEPEVDDEGDDFDDE